MPFDALRQTQPASAKELSDVISAGMMPNSILISGSRGSSRLTGALDLAFYHAGGDSIPERDVVIMQEKLP